MPFPPEYPNKGQAGSEALTEALESDSECSTEGTSSNYGSDDDLDDDSDDDLQMVDARAERIEVQEATVGGTRRGLITLGEEIR